MNAFDVFKRHARGTHRVLLESAGPRGRVSENSYIFWDPVAIFDSRKIRGNPFTALENFYNKHRRSGKFGIVGYISYDASRHLEQLPNGKHDSDLAGLPEMLFFVPGKVRVFCHSREGGKKLGARFMNLAPNTTGSRVKPGMTNLRITNLHPSTSRREFEQMVARAKEYIAAGDIYQANLSQRFSFRYSGDPLDLYARLREINPSPFSAFMEMDGVHIVSSSPERLIRVRGGICETRPIAGTRPRGKNFREDGKLSKELLLNEKEKAEHLMLVDLERNDLGRVSEFGSVRVDEWMALEKYSHVIHIVSNVTGRLRKDKNCFDALRAMFPGGTITGCPKIRSMEIIHGLEPVRRGIYTGSIGYIGFDGSMDFNIVIRTILCREGKGFFQVGAGIVHDSVPAREYDETLHKAQAMMHVL
ncbi:MAG: aminodeoxychorismate synthase component I [Candidatus Omnitrophica bacterium]|nr:aminodeoxychorismate synthase component I [Candidatus Omnitrophota bacterium]